MKIPPLAIPVIGLAIWVAYAFNDLIDSFQPSVQADGLVAELRGLKGADGVVASEVADIWEKYNPEPNEDDVVALDLLVRKIKHNSDYGVEYIVEMRNR